jgi:hypothetical protein
MSTIENDGTEAVARKKGRDSARRRELRELTERLLRLTRIGNHADRLGALTVLAYSYDLDERGVDDLIVWMNKSSQRDAQAVLLYVRSGRSRRSKLINESQYKTVIDHISKLGRTIALERLERSGVVKPSHFEFTEDDLLEAEDDEGTFTVPDEE